MYTCALRPTGVYGDGDELIRDFYKQCVQRGGVVIQGIPEHIEHGRVYVGEMSACYLQFQQPHNTSAACLQPEENASTKREAAGRLQTGHSYRGTKSRSPVITHRKLPVAELSCP